MQNCVVKFTGTMAAPALPSKWKILACPIMQSMEPNVRLILIRVLSLMPYWNMNGIPYWNFVWWCWKKINTPVKYISDKIPFIESCLRFFDEHYQYLAKQRGTKALDGNGKLVLYPGSGAETLRWRLIQLQQLRRWKLLQIVLLILWWIKWQAIILIPLFLEDLNIL